MIAVIGVWWLQRLVQALVIFAMYDRVFSRCRSRLFAVKRPAPRPARADVKRAAAGCDVAGQDEAVICRNIVATSDRDEPLAAAHRALPSDTTRRDPAALVVPI